MAFLFKVLIQIVIESKKNIPMHDNVISGEMFEFLRRIFLRCTRI